VAEDRKGNRRELRKTGATISTAIAEIGLAGTAESHTNEGSRSPFRARPIETVWVGIVGVGGMESDGRREL
jgi:hypothetical protein